MSKLTDILSAKREKPLLMTHLITGYPTLESSLGIARAMIRGGASILEIQIPFSDPVADGPAIVEASHEALRGHVKVEDALALAKKLGEEHTTPLVLMSYGITRFVEHAAEAGVAGIILPDIPIDTEEGKEFLAAAKKFSVHPILVVSPGVPEERLRFLTKEASGFIYSTSRQGITGADSKFGSELKNFLSLLHKMTDIPVAVGFGVKSKEDVLSLASQAEIIVVGSAFVSLIKNTELKTVPLAIEDLVKKLLP